MFSYWAKPEHGHDPSRLLNDHLAEVVTASPAPLRRLGRCRCSADRAIRELERCMNELGLRELRLAARQRLEPRPRGVVSSVRGRRTARAAVFVHPGTCWAANAWEVLAALVGRNAAESGAGDCSVIFGGVLNGCAVADLLCPRRRRLHRHSGPDLSRPVPAGPVCVDNPRAGALSWEVLRRFTGP